MGENMWIVGCIIIILQAITLWRLFQKKPIQIPFVEKQIPMLESRKSRVIKRDENDQIIKKI